MVAQQGPSESSDDEISGPTSLIEEQQLIYTPEAILNAINGANTIISAKVTEIELHGGPKSITWRPEITNNQAMDILADAFEDIEDARIASPQTPESIAALEVSDELKQRFVRAMSAWDNMPDNNSHEWGVAYSEKDQAKAAPETYTRTQRFFAFFRNLIV